MNNAPTHIYGSKNLTSFLKAGRTFKDKKND